jgi:hypothetical protein
MLGSRRALRSEPSAEVDRPHAPAVVEAAVGQVAQEAGLDQTHRRGVGVLEDPLHDAEHPGEAAGVLLVECGSLITPWMFQS